jgi:hypothetical protein
LHPARGECLEWNHPKGKKSRRGSPQTYRRPPSCAAEKQKITARFDVIEAGEVSVSAAAEVARLPEPEQHELVARGEKDILKAAQQIRRNREETKRAKKLEENKARRSGQRWMLIIGPARSEEASNVGPFFIGEFKGLADVEYAAARRLSDPTAFVVLDITATAERITNALKNDDGQTVAA